MSNLLNHRWRRSRLSAFLFTVLATILPTQTHAQLQITEVMHNPAGADALWEWIEVRNTGASSLNLDGWVFDDDDDTTIPDDDENPDDGPNIKAANGNTIIPAGGIAVLYPGDSLNFTPARFTSAWGAGINLIPVDGFTSLTATDAIGLWPSYSAYEAAAIPGATTSPRRTFAGATATLNFTTGFPSASAGRSIAWNGTGSATAGANWVQSTSGDDGAPGPFQEVTSSETTLPSSPINDVADLGNPHKKPLGSAASGLLITEIMYAPASPAATAGWTSGDFEWIEVFNNSGAAIDFEDFVFDDHEGEFDDPNIAGGTLAAGQLGVLFNGEQLTSADMEVMWGPGNYIAVDPWPSLNNTGGDTIAIWDDHDAYLEEEIDGEDHRAHSDAIAAVTYNTVAGQGWPTATPAGRSIFLNNLSANPNVGASWTKSGAMADSVGSFNPEELLQDAVDHPGGDIGSPGKLGTASVGDLVGDYNDDGRVDAVDYTVWRNNFGQPAGSIQNRDQSNSGPINATDFAVWKSHYTGNAPGGGGIAAAERVPEPGAFVLATSVVVSLLFRRTPRTGQDGRAMYRR
jgi:hypothetical protein